MESVIKGIIWGISCDQSSEIGQWRREGLRAGTMVHSK
jgi:hypothetical protein